MAREGAGGGPVSALSTASLPAQKQDALPESFARLARRPLPESGGLTALRPGADSAPSLLYLYVFDWHASGKLIVYGLAGGAKAPGPGIATTG